MAHLSNKQEIDDLLAIVSRDLADAEGDISADWRFGTEYMIPMIILESDYHYPILRSGCTFPLLYDTLPVKSIINIFES